jgi:hypothetical protein
MKLHAIFNENYVSNRSHEVTYFLARIYMCSHMEAVTYRTCHNCYSVPVFPNLSSYLFRGTQTCPFICHPISTQLLSEMKIVPLKAI